MQAVEEVQEMALRAAFEPPLGIGGEVVSELQTDPASFRRKPLGTLLLTPIAMHQMVAGQETPDVDTPKDSSLAHFVPFHSSELPTPAKASLPTPMHIVAEAQETPASEFSERERSGLDCVFHSHLPSVPLQELEVVKLAV